PRHALQEPRWRLGAVGGPQRRLGSDREADDRSHAVGRSPRRARATEATAGRRHGHREGPWLVALALVESTMVTTTRTATAVLLTALAAAGCGGDTKPVAPPPPEVSISQAVEEPVQETLEFT